MGINNGIKTKDRVKGFGEVYTPNSIVNKMLDVADAELKQEISYNFDTEHQLLQLNNIDSMNLAYIKMTYLEPACGNGQFLINILNRKLATVNKLPIKFRQYGFIIAFCTIYGIDIQSDNVLESIDRLYRIAKGESVLSFDLNERKDVIQFIPKEFSITDDMLKTVKYILENNIICGNALKSDTDDNIIMFNYTFDDTKQAISINTDTLHEDTTLSTTNVIGNNVEFDKLYTLKTISALKQEKFNHIELDETDDDFDF